MEENKSLQNRGADYAASSLKGVLGAVPIVGSALAESLRRHLVQLGLLKPNYPFVGRGELPEFDSSSGTFKNSGYDITLLGRLLLRSIDLLPKELELGAEESGPPDQTVE